MEKYWHLLLWFPCSICVCFMHVSVTTCFSLSASMLSVLRQCHWFNSYELDFLCSRILDQIVKLLMFVLKHYKEDCVRKYWWISINILWLMRKKKMCHFGEYHLTQIKDCFKCTLFCIVKVIELLGIVWLQHLTWPGFWPEIYL